MTPDRNLFDHPAVKNAVLWAFALILGWQPAAWAANPPRKDGFNELFVSSFLLHREGTSGDGTGALQKLFGAENPGLVTPDAADLDWASINYWVGAIAGAVPANGRGSAALIRDIVDLNYIEPQEGQFPFEADIVAVLSIYQAHGMNVILAGAVSGSSGQINEPAWIRRRVMAAPQQNQMSVRIQVYADVIARFVKRLNSNYGDNGWRQWLQANVSIEPINEFNVNITGYPIFAANLDSKVQKMLAANGTPLKVISSSIVSGTDQDYLEWFRKYYKSGAPASILPNIHLYYSAALDNGQFTKALQRFKSVVDTLYRDVTPGSGTKIIIGEVGQSLAEPADPSAHSDLMRNLIDNPGLIDLQTKIAALAFWRLFATFIPLDCTRFASNCGAVQARETTFGFVHLATAGYAGLPGTPLYIEPQLHNYFGL